MLRHLFFVVASFALAFSTGASRAACPGGWPDVPTEFGKADQVVLGWVSEARTIIDSEDPYAIVATEFVVETLKTYKGEPRTTFTVYNSNDSGRFDMEFRHDYLLFLREWNGRWSVDNCGNSFDLERTDATYSPRRPDWTFDEVMAFKPQADAAIESEVAARDALMRRSQPAATLTPPPPKSPLSSRAVWIGVILILLGFIATAFVKRRRTV